jgi:hypothetical protein
MNWFQKQLRKVLDCPPCPEPPGPGVSRPGLEYCYFGLQPTDPPQIHNHVTIAHIGSWGDWNNFDGMLNMVMALGHDAKKAGIERLIFTPDFCCFTNYNQSPRQVLPLTTMQAKLITFADRLRSENLIEQVWGMYVIDEPNKPENALSAANVSQVCSTIRDVFSHYLLTAPKLCITYWWTWDHFPGIESLDYAGFDNYGAPIFTNGMYNHLRSQLKPEQKSIILPGGSNPWRENPDPFYEFAQNNLEVGMIMPFLWFDNPPEFPHGIVSNGMAPQYTAVGQKILAVHAP